MAKLEDGFSDPIVFDKDSPKVFFEKETKSELPVAGSKYRTKAPKKLKGLAEVNLTAEYDPDAYTKFRDALFGKPQKITVETHERALLISGVGYCRIGPFRKFEFDGWLDKFEPDGASESGEPEASVTIIKIESPNE